MKSAAAKQSDDLKTALHTVSDLEASLARTSLLLAESRRAHEQDIANANEQLSQWHARYDEDMKAKESELDVSASSMELTQMKYEAELHVLKQAHTIALEGLESSMAQLKLDIRAKEVELVLIRQDRDALSRDFADHKDVAEADLAEKDDTISSLIKENMEFQERNRVIEEVQLPEMISSMQSIQKCYDDVTKQREELARQLTAEKQLRAEETSNLRLHLSEKEESEKVLSARLAAAESELKTQSEAHIVEIESLEAEKEELIAQLEKMKKDWISEVDPRIQAVCHPMSFVEYQYLQLNTIPAEMEGLRLVVGLRQEEIKELKKRNIELEKHMLIQQTVCPIALSVYSSNVSSSKRTRSNSKTELMIWK
jgi:hypothetical protein